MIKIWTIALVFVAAAFASDMPSPCFNSATAFGKCEAISASSLLAGHRVTWSLTSFNSILG